MRIAVGGLAIECCSFSPLPTRLNDLTHQQKLIALQKFLSAIEGI